jgi:hypothetical protein
MRRVVNFVAVLILGCVVTAVAWLYATNEGRDLRRMAGERAGAGGSDAAEKAAAENLKATDKGSKTPHVIVLNSAPPDTHVATIAFNSHPIGDEGFKNVVACYMLESLSIQKCIVTDQQLGSLAGLEHLASLVVIDSTIDIPALPQLEKLSGLVSLNLKGTPVTDAALAHIAKIKALTMLDLTRTHVTNDGLKLLTDMPNLSWLLVTDDDVNDAGIAVLEKLPSLHMITAMGTKVTDEEVKRWKKVRPSVKVEIVPSAG